MDGGRRVFLSIALLLTVSTLAAAQPDGFYDQGGVEYYMAVGDVTVGHASKGLDYQATDLLPFTGCAVAKLRPDADHGRIRTIAVIDGIDLVVEMTEFSAERQDMQGGIAIDSDAEPLYVDGSRLHGDIQTPKVRADIAAWGTATIRVNDRPLDDPATGGDTFAASFFVTSQGFRDDATGEIHNSDGTPYTPGSPAIRNDGEREMHLRIESLEDGLAPTWTDTFQAPGPGESSTGYFAQTNTYSQLVPFQNQRYGGTGSVDIEGSTFLAMDGDNELTFTLYAPNGTRLANYTATPGLNEEFSHRFEFPLESFGEYAVVVEGRVSNSEYSLKVEQHPAERFDLNFWWDGLAGGYDALAATDACTEAVEGGVVLNGIVPPRTLPPGFPWKVTIVTLLAVTTAAMVMIKLIVMVRTAVAHRNAMRG